MLEGVDKFHEVSSELESNIKFWLPKFFPNKVRVIVTASRSSQAYEYLQSQGCRTITVEAEEHILSQVIESYRDRNFIMDRIFVDRFLSLLNRRVEKGTREGSLYIKTAIACLCPYETLHIAECRNLKLEKIKDGISSFNFNLLDEVETNEELIRVILQHYEHCLMSSALFRQILVSLSIASQGFSKLEVLSMVSGSHD